MIKVSSMSIGILLHLSWLTALASAAAGSTPLEQEQEQEQQHYNHNSNINQRQRYDLYSQSHSQQRRLGDFDELNELLDGVHVGLPPVNISETLLFPLDLELFNISCSNVNLQDIRTTYQREGEGINNDNPLLSNQKQQKMTFAVEIVNLTMSCSLNYMYEYWIAEGNGLAQADSQDSWATAALEFWSNDFDRLAPHQVFVQDCHAHVNLQRLSFQGDVLAAFLDTFESLIRSSLRAVAGELICQELRSLLDAHELLQRADAVLAQYPPHLEMDPLAAEKALTVPRDDQGQVVQVLDFQNPQSSVGKLLHLALEKGLEFLSATDDSDDAGMPGDLRINTMLRDALLDENRSLLVDLAETSFANDTTIFATHDKLTNTRISLNSIQVLGLDTLTHFAPLGDIGRYTIQNELVWDSLAFEIEITIDIKPSTKADSFIANPGDTHVVERVKIKFGMEQMDALASTLIAINKNILEGIQLGSLRNMENLLPCFLSTLVDIDISALSISAVSLQPPTLDNFVSVGIDRVVSGSVEAAYEMYKNVLLGSAPSFFHQTARTFVMKKVFDDDKENTAKFGTCDAPPLHLVGSIDFRDFMLEPQEALALGASGEQPYGNIVPQLWSFIYANLEERKDNSTPPAINELIQAYTESQSGSIGSLQFPSTILTRNATVNLYKASAYVELSLSNFRVENMDSVGEFRLLNPVADKPNELMSNISFGVGSRPLGLGVTALLSVSDGAVMSIRNEVDLTLTMNDVNIFFQFLLEISEQSLFSFPMRDIGNHHCWLAAIPPKNGSLSLLDHFVFANDIQLNATCRECSGPDFDDLIMELYSLTIDQGVEMTSRFIGSDFLSSLADRLISNAALGCPHSDEYDAEAAQTVNNWMAPAETIQEQIDESNRRDKTAKLLNAANGLMAALLLVFVVWTKKFFQRRNEKWMQSLGKRDKRRVSKHLEKKRQKEDEINRRGQSIFRSTCLPRHVRIGAPIAIMVTLMFWVAGHNLILASLNIQGTIGGEEYTLYNFMNFKFYQSTILAYENGGIEMALLMWVFTGLWPYVKLITTMVIWFLPPERLSVSRRGSILLWIDTMAKLSIMDMVSILIAVATLLVFIGGPDDDSGSENSHLYSLKLIVMPSWGVYCILIAQRTTRVSSQFFLECHQKVVSATEAEIEEKPLLVECSSNNITIDTTQELTQEFNQELTQELTQELDDSSVSLWLHRQEADFAVPETEQCDIEVSSNYRALTLDRTPETFRDELSRASSQSHGIGEAVSDFEYNNGASRLDLQEEHGIPNGNETIREEKRDCLLTKSSAIPVRSSSMRGIDVENDGTLKPTESTEELKPGERVREQQLFKQESYKSNRMDGLVGEFGSSFTSSPSFREGSLSRSKAESFRDEEIASTVQLTVDRSSTYRASIISTPWSSVSVRLRRFQKSRYAPNNSTIAVGLIGLTILAIAIIGILLAPSVALDTEAVLNMAVESGKSFSEAATDYSVYQIVCEVLLQSRFVLKDLSDYIGLGLLFVVAVLAAVIFPMWKISSSLLRSWRERRENRKDSESAASWSKKGTRKNELIVILSQLNAWHDMEVYIVSFVIASWQLTAVSIYTLHYYCGLLKDAYDTLVFLGLVVDGADNGNSLAGPVDQNSCFRAQLTLLPNVMVILGAFLALFISFSSQAMGQYKKNQKEAELSVEKDKSFAYLRKPKKDPVLWPDDEQ